MTNKLFRSFMEDLVSSMTEEEREFVRKRLETDDDESIRNAFGHAYYHWLFIRDGEAAKDVLLKAFRTD